MTHTPRTLLAFAAALTLLTACAPATHTTITRPPLRPPLTPAADYHPNEPGVTLTYLDGTGGAYRLTTLAPTLLTGAPHQHQRYEGPAGARETYRIINDSGVHLARIDDDSGVTTYDPPLLELPPAGRLQVGLTWGGESTARHYQSAEAARPDDITTVAYLHTVTDTLNVRIGDHRVTAYLIATEEYHRRGDDITTSRRTRWYAPYWGDVINASGHRLEDLRD